jgi:SpoVK/Ycf46/Vps4 family AAA+-type ATPase
MARADLLKRLFEAHQKRDDAAFRQAASSLIDDEKKKHHDILAAELGRILNNGTRSLERINGVVPAHDPVPVDAERRTPLLQVQTPDRYKDDLVLADQAANALDRLVREFRSSDVLEAHGLRPSRRVLFCGPPGCGKTASAEVLATELGLPLLYVRFDAVVSSLLGETAANVRKVFDYASRGQWVILFDEFDGIGRSRDDATEHGEIKRVVNAFLQLLDGFSGNSLVIAATNFGQALDPAIWRRFDDVVHFAKPNRRTVAALVLKRLAGIKLPKRLSEQLSRGLAQGSHADVERVCTDIRKQCALDGSSVVRPRDVTEALERWRGRVAVLNQASHKGPPSVDRE